VDWVKDVLALVPKANAASIALVIVFCLLVFIVIVIIRAALGHSVEAFGIRLGRREDHSACKSRARELESAIEALSLDTLKKRNVIRAVRELVHEVAPLVNRRTDVNQRIKRFANDTLARVLAVITKGVEDHHRAAIWVRRREGEYVMYEAVGFRREAVSDAKLSESSIIAWVFRHGEFYNCADIAADRNFEQRPRTSGNYSSLVCVPVHSPGGSVIAVLAVDAEARGYFDDDHVFLVKAFAELLGMVLGERPAEDG
jgi:GAF domain-containing protein